MPSTSTVVVRQHPIVCLSLVLQWLCYMVVSFFVSNMPVLQQPIGMTSLTLATLFLRFLLCILLIQCGKIAIQFWTTRYVIMPKKLIRQHGWIARRTTEILLSKIESIHVYQSFWGRVLGYGSLAVQGTGGLSDPFHYVPKPFAFRDQIDQRVHALTETP